MRATGHRSRESRTGHLSVSSDRNSFHVTNVTQLHPYLVDFEVRRRGTTGKVSPLGLPDAALRDETRGPRSGVLPGSTPTLTDDTPQVPSSQPRIPSDPQYPQRPNQQESPGREQSKSKDANDLDASKIHRNYMKVWRHGVGGEGMTIDHKDN